MRTLKLGECILIALVSSGLFLGAAAINSSDTAARIEWKRSCTLAVKGDQHTYACGRFKQTFSVQGDWDDFLLHGRKLGVVCIATRKPWPDNDLKLDCKPQSAIVEERA